MYSLNCILDKIILLAVKFLQLDWLREVANSA